MFYLFIFPFIGLEFRLLLSPPLSRPSLLPCSSRYSRAIYHADLTVSFVVGHHCLPRKVYWRVRFKSERVRENENRCDQKGEKWYNSRPKWDLVLPVRHPFKSLVSSRDFFFRRVAWCWKYWMAKKNRREGRATILIQSAKESGKKKNVKLLDYSCQEFVSVHPFLPYVYLTQVFSHPRASLWEGC